MKKNESEECPLKKVEEIEHAAKKFGFYWSHIDQLIEQIQSECIEVQDAWKTKDRKHLQEEIGDILLAASSLAIFCDLNPQATLRQSIDKFQGRYDNLVKLAHKEGYEDLRGQSTDVLMQYWIRAKKLP